MSEERNRRVLVIDDNRSIHDDFRKILAPVLHEAADLDASETAVFGSTTDHIRQIRFELESAYQGSEGAQLVETAVNAGKPFSVAFVDVRMPPGWDGIETTRNIWLIDPDIQIVICTAYADYSWGEMFEKFGQRDGLLILKKPFDAVEAYQLAYALSEKWWLLHVSRRKMEDLECRVANRTNELAASNQALKNEVLEHQRAAKELQWKTAFLEAQVNASIDGILVVDQNGRKILQNERTAHLLGIPQAIADGDNDQDQLSWVANRAKDPAQFLAKVAELNAHPEEISRDEIEFHDGTILDRYSSPVTDKAGNYYGRIWTFRDITARKRLEEAMRESEKRFAGAFEHAPIGVALVAPDGRWLMVNRSLCELTGYTESQLLSRTFQEITYPEDLAADLGKLQTLIAGETRSYQIEKRYIHARGHLVTVLLEVSLVRDDAGQPRYFIAQIQDISKRKRLEAQLFQSQQLEIAGKLAGGVAHEFNSILTTIIGQSEMILADLAPGNPIRKKVTEINQAAGRAEILTRQLLAYGRKQMLCPENIDLNSVLVDMESTLLHLMGKSVNVHIVPAVGLHIVRADPHQIEQVIINLAMNAADAMPNGGIFTLETANVTLDQEYVSRVPNLKAGEYAMLAMTDTGSGMSEAATVRVFEPFYTTKGVGEGTGLGLSMCYGIMKQSGGHISVYSELARGTAFKIYLPKVETPTRTVVPNRDSAALPHGTESILLVEDDPVLREMAATVLKRLGYTVLTASDGIEALRLKQRRDVGHIDLLFTDVVMPHMSGKELAERMRSLFPHTRILFTSASPENAIVHQGLLKTGAPFLQKPFTPSAMARKLREVLDQPNEMPPISFESDDRA